MIMILQRNLKKMAAYDYYYDKRPQILEVPNGIILPSNRLDRDAPFFWKGRSCNSGW